MYNIVPDQLHVQGFSATVLCEMAIARCAKAGEQQLCIKYWSTYRKSSPSNQQTVL